MHVRMAAKHAMIMVGVKGVPFAEHIGIIVHISLRIIDTNCTYISQRITGHLEAGESQTAVSLYIAVSSEDIKDKLNNVYYVL